MRLLLASALFLLATHQASATPNLVWCNNCTNDQNAKAAKTTAVGATSITTYVGDTVKKTVNAYTVYISNDDSKNPPTRVTNADLITPDTTLANYISAGIQYYNIAPVGWHKHYTIYTDNPSANSVYVPIDVNVYNIADTGPQQNNLNSWLNGNTLPTFGVLSAATGVVGMVGAFHFVDVSALPTTTETLVFQDGARIDGAIDKLTQKWKVDPNTAEDSHGNSVPYLDGDGKVHNLGGQHNFDTSYGNPLDESNFRNRAQQLGVMILNGPSGSGTPPTRHWICTYDDATDTYTCWFNT